MHLGLWNEEQALAHRKPAAIGIDLLDVTSGVLVRDRGARPPNREGVNVEFAAETANLLAGEL